MKNRIIRVIWGAW